MSVVGAGLAWYQAGACVLPVKSDGSKSPAVPTWREYQSERPSLSQTIKMIDGVSGIGLLTGAVSGSIEMLELEKAAVEYGWLDELRSLVERTIPTLWERLEGYVERSPSGGIHWNYRVEGTPVLGSHPLARQPKEQTPESPSKIRVLIETRGEGGFTVLAPSNGTTHPSGGAWEVIKGGIATMATLTAEEYTALHDCCRMFDRMPQAEPIAPRASSSTPSDEVKPGEAWAEVTSWDDILEPHGWKLIDTQGEKQLWRRPGKPIGVSATTNNAGTDALFVFSSSTEFEPMRTYTKFGAHTQLNHNGDFATATRELRRQGFGGKSERTVLLSPSSIALSAPVPPSGAITTSTPEVAMEAVASTWRPEDLSAYIDGNPEPIQPCLWEREDGVLLLYPGRVHAILGETESGKSFVMHSLIADVLRRGGKVALLDYESAATTVVPRIKSMGTSGQQVADGLHYIRPATNPFAVSADLDAWTDLCRGSYDLIVLDGVNEALATMTLSMNDNDEVTRWERTIPRQLAEMTGAPVVLIDHVTKSTENRGRFAIGAQAKLATLGGVSYMLDVVRPLGVGMVGELMMWVGKDREGVIRPKQVDYNPKTRMGKIASVIVDSTGPRTYVTLNPPTQGSTADVNTVTGEIVPDKYGEIMERITAALKESVEAGNATPNKSALLAKVKGNKGWKEDAFAKLVEGGYIQVRSGASNSRVVVLRRPYWVADERQRAAEATQANIIPLFPQGSPETEQEA